MAFDIGDRVELVHAHPDILVGTRGTIMDITGNFIRTIHVQFDGMSDPTRIPEAKLATAQ
jgi:hypothetical protein